MQNRVIGVDLVSIGWLSAALVHPREVFKALILQNAAAFLVVHNHPSGVVTPSAEDARIAQRLREGGDFLGIPLIDSVIVGADGHHSMREDDSAWKTRYA